MVKSVIPAYVPNIVPSGVEDLPRFLNEELERIRQAMQAQPVALAVEEVGDFAVTQIVTWERAFIGATPAWDIPGGNFDSATAQWTCPQTGLYSIDVQLEVAPFGAGNKNYYAGIRIYHLSGQTVDYRESSDGGVDNVPLGVNMAGLVPLTQGDVVAVDMTVVHDTWVGVAPYDIGWQMLSVSG